MQPQPISTAPRDGTEIWVWAPYESRPHWSRDHDGWFRTWWEDFNGWDFGCLAPTLWLLA